jgi:hypothetical protein
MAPLWLFSFDEISPTTWLQLIFGSLTLAVVTLVGYGIYVFSSGREKTGKSKGEGPPDDPFVHGSKSERRTSLRRRGTEVEVRLRDADGKREVGTAWVVDRSMGGLCLMTPEQIEKGTVLSVRTLNAPETIPWIQIEVRSCRVLDRGGHEIGCQFVRPPTWNILLLFG